jgi:non-specific serine/threonine protein kinase
LGRVAQHRGDPARAAALLRESLALFTEMGDRHALGAAQHALGLALWGEGDAAGGAALLRESLALRRQLGEPAGIAECLEGLAAVAAGRGDACGPARATPLLGAAAALRERLHTPLPAPDRARHEATVARARAALGDAAWAAAEATGRELPLEETIAAALAEPRMVAP